MSTPERTPLRPLRLGLRITAFGLLGVIALLPSLPALLQNLPAAGLPPLPVLMAIQVIQMLILIAATAALGVWMAPKVGFEAPVLAGRRPLSDLSAHAPFSLLTGALAGVAMIALDWLFKPYLPEQLYALATKPVPYDLVPSLLYGGITEEILLRWGLMSLLTWLLYRLFSGGKGPVRSGVLWTGILAAALLFGAGHLPAVITIVGNLTLPLVIRTFLLNGIGGVLFGWLFARRGLESAMLAHMGAHIGMFVVRVLFAG